MSELTNTILRAEGFSCPSCVAKIEKTLHRLDGVSQAKVHFNTGRIEVSHEPTLPVDALIAAIGKAGYQAKPAAF